MASISVPIEKHKHFPYSRDPFGSPRQGGGFGGGSSYNRQMGLHDNGPPYIVKLHNLPVTATDGFVEDLFHSRFTPFVKFKIVADPSSNILETHIIKRVAFVELDSFQEMNKVLKWQDLYFKAGRRVVTEMADFQDFQNCMAFNQEHKEEIQKIQDDFIFQKQNQHTNLRRGSFDQGGGRSVNPLPPTKKPQLLNPHLNNNLYPSLPGKESTILQGNSEASDPGPVEHKNKPNPFGAAKPVDVLAKQHEIDKKLITINHTTVKTLGSLADEQGHKNKPERHKSTVRDSHHTQSTHVPSERRPSQKESRRPSVNILKRRPSLATEPESHEQSGETNDADKSQLASAPIPDSIYTPKDNNKSLAEQLSFRNGDERTPSSRGRNTPISVKNSPKPAVNKPVILKKKTNSPAVDRTVTESEYINNNEDNVDAKNISQDKLKQINDSLSKAELLDKITEQTYTEKIPSTTEDKAAAVDSIDDKTESPKVSSHVEAERAKDRPNFKKHFAELNKRQFLPKEKPHNHQNPRINLHAQNFNQSYHKNQTLNRRQTNIKEQSNGNSVPASDSTERLSSDVEAVKSKRSDSNVDKNVEINDDRVVRLRGKNKTNFTGQNKTGLPKPIKDINNDESKLPKLQATPKPTRLNKTGKKIKDGIKNGIKHGIKDENVSKENMTHPDSPIKEIHDKISVVLNEDNKPMRRSKKSKSPKEPSPSSGGKQDNGAGSVNEKLESEVADPRTIFPENSTDSSRGRGGGRGRSSGRGRGRGAARGSSRGGRGRGNFNLHYVRSKDEGNVEK